MVTLFNVISQDGFIARKDGSEDFIPDKMWQHFLNLCMEYGTLVIGRKTYETIQNYDDTLLAPFEKLPIKRIVVSNDEKFQPKSSYTLVHSPKDILKLSEKILVSSGPSLNNSMLSEHLVDKIIFYEIPVLIVEGIKPFSEGNFDLLSLETPQNIAGVITKKFSVKYK